MCVFACRRCGVCRRRRRCWGSPDTSKGPLLVIYHVPINVWKYQKRGESASEVSGCAFDDPSTKVKSKDAPGGGSLQSKHGLNWERVSWRCVEEVIARWRSSEVGGHREHFQCNCNPKHPKILGNFCIFTNAPQIQLQESPTDKQFSSTPTLLPLNFGFLHIIPNGFQIQSQEHLDLCSYDEFGVISHLGTVSPLGPHPPPKFRLLQIIYSRDQAHC